HDFNNMLTAILGHSELALRDLNRESPARPKVERIKQTVCHLAELTNQMLAYSGKGRFVVEPLDLSRVVEDMTHLLQLSISKKAFIKYNLERSISAIDADASQVRQVIMNLVVNASEAIGDKSGVISVSTGMMEVDREYLSEVYLDDDLEPGFFVFLEVSDTGCGMDFDTQARIFDPFFSTKFTGRGLGMAAVLGIVRGHHGAIKVYSEPGTGTAFKVLFPVSQQDVPRERPGDSPAMESAGGVVLVVDDEETVRAVASMMLTAAGYTVLSATDGRAALELFRGKFKNIDAVLLDLTMPHLDGVATFREMRRIRADIPVVLTSGYNEQDATNRFAGRGLAGFVKKPYDMNDLLDAVAKAIKG
ncbi:MAG: response regulator, partial [Proteobacteria bacterium]|nr:response regulator [Pseudomonadota bacterium]